MICARTIVLVVTLVLMRPWAIQAQPPAPAPHRASALSAHSGDAGGYVNGYTYVAPSYYLTPPVVYAPSVVVYRPFAPVYAPPPVVVQPPPVWGNDLRNRAGIATYRAGTTTQIFTGRNPVPRPASAFGMPGQYGNHHGYDPYNVRWQRR